MERIAIIDHLEHTLFIEDIDEDMLQEKYGGEEEEYIKDNYWLSENWSWEYIVETYYVPKGGEDGIEISNLEELALLNELRSEK